MDSVHLDRDRKTTNLLVTLGRAILFIALISTAGTARAEFVVCTCADGRQTISDGAENCPIACGDLPPPPSVQSCSGVSLNGATPLSSADRIVQCGPGALFQGGLGTTQQTALDDLIPHEKSAVDTVLNEHQLPEADRGNVMGFARDSVRGILYADLLGIIKTADPRTTSEQGIVDAYAEQVRLKRLDAAEFALSEFHRWEAVVCNNHGQGYVPPLGFSYPSQDAGCTQIGQTFGGPQPPSSEEFIAYGTAHAYNKLNTDPQTAAVAARTARNIQFTKILVGAAVAGFSTALLLAFTTLGTTIITAILPFAFLPVAGSTAASVAAAAGTVLATSAAAIGGAVAVVIVAIAIAVLQGISVFEAAAIPGELQKKVDDAQVAPDLRESIKTKEGLQELYGVFIESTMPDYPGTSAPPAPIASDRRFRVKDENRQNLGVFTTIDVQSPVLPGPNWETRLSGGWFVPKHVLANNTVIENLSLSLPYLDWEGNKRLAWRRGNKFVITTLDTTSITDADAISDEIKYKDWDGTKLIASIAIDDTPPSITPQVTGTVGNNGWYTSNVNVTWTVQDPESAIQSKTDCDNQSITSDGLSSFTCTAISEGGTGSKSVSVNRDATPPGIVGSRNPGANAQGWNNSNVSVSFTCTDAFSRVASCGPNQDLSSEGANQSATGTAVDNAGNSQNATVGGISIDKTAPVVSVTGVVNGATYTEGSVPVAGCSATTDALSGVQTSAVLSLTGGTANGVGSFTASCTGAVDKAGNPGSASATYQVHYPFSNFFQPVDNAPSVNQLKAGAAVAVNFSLGGDFGLDILAAGSPNSQGMACSASDFFDDIEQTVTAGSSSLTYDPVSGQYSYIWKTNKAWAGTCRQLLVTLDDGTVHKAYFKFK